MNRRAFLTSVMTGIVGLPSFAIAQRVNKVWRVAVLTSTPRPARESSSSYNDFLRELRQLGYEEGRNLTVEWRHPDYSSTQGDRLERTHREAVALVQWRPDVLVAANGAIALAFRDTATRLPVVVIGAGDLVALGLVASLARPGGNVTGLQVLSPELTGKRLELLSVLVPKIERIALLHEAAPASRPEAVTYWDRIFTDLESAARSLRMRAVRFTVASPEDLNRVFPEMKAQGVQGLIIPGSGLLNAQAERVGRLMVEHRLPGVEETSSHVEAGGLISYGHRQADLNRRAAHYVDRILKGASPGDLPVEQANQFELTINLKTAKALGLTIPQSVLVRADRLIQ